MCYLEKLFGKYLESYHNFNFKNKVLWFLVHVCSFIFFTIYMYYMHMTIVIANLHS